MPSIFFADMLLIISHGVVSTTLTQPKLSANLIVAGHLGPVLDLPQEILHKAY